MAVVAAAVCTLDELDNTSNERLIAINGRARGYDMARKQPITVFSAVTCRRNSSDLD